MSSDGKEWDEDPWDHSIRDDRKKGLAKAEVTPFTKERPFIAQKTPSGYGMTTISAAVLQAIRESIREEVGSTVDTAFQKIMDRLDELEEAVSRER